ncbi:hypothetical protein C8J57DRAFT_1658920 [Mycena rebaudengoi]|nr:hypothetical protein C8J57DRAFT_1658920 [Mycena rebaudengoi]
MHRLLTKRGRGEGYWEPRQPWMAGVVALRPTCTELAATIATHIGVEKGSNLTKKIAHYFAHAPPSLLVLDNLETTWEPLSSRPKVEEFLSLVTDVPHLGLMITLRGAERPSKVKWTRPFLAPLKPLSDVAAWQTFIEVADEGHDDASIKELLELTGNLPLAVSLMASVAGSEGCAQALSQWKLESTRMLSEGYDQRSSLDISIMLSYTSSRMTPGAQELLSILSLLPDGLADADLVQAQLPLPDILACKATLIQTSLAFVSQDQHLKVLVPIREHMMNTHPPREPLKLKLREHFHQILDLWNQFKNLNVTDIHPQISRNLGNIETVLHDGLESEGPDIVQNFRSILFLNHFYDRLSGQMLHWKSNPIFGEYLIELLEVSEYLPNLDLNSTVTLGNQYFTSKAPLEQAKWYRAVGIYFRGAKSDLAGALKSYQKAYSLAENVTHYWQTIGMLNVFCKNPAISWLLLVNNKVAILSSCQPPSYNAILANLNIALIDIATGADSKIIRQNLHMAAELCLRDDALGTANALFEKCFVASQHLSELPLLCLERLGDLSTGMNDIQTTLRWTGIFLGLALNLKDKHQTMQAFRCLGQIFSVQGDNETALSLFNVALDGFTFMDVHRWRADCMVRIADILNDRGEVMKAVELWKTARPLFERSSQMKDIIKIDAKLAEVDSAVLAKYEEQLQQLLELHVPAACSSSSTTAGMLKAYQQRPDTRLLHGSEKSPDICN